MLRALIECVDVRVRDRSVARDADLEMKRIALAGMMVVNLFCAGASVNASGLSSGQPSWGPFIVLWACIGLNTAAAASILLWRRFGPVQAGTWLLPLGILCIFGDWATLGTTDVWTLAVLIMDAMLAYHCPPWASRWYAGLTILYLFIRTTQESVDFGLWDPMRPFAERYEPYLCPTKDPTLGMSTLLFRVLVFSLDYMITRGFAETMTTQYHVVTAAVSVSEQVAQLLAAYRTEDARRVVEEEGQLLPAALHDSYVSLLNNLDTYRVFLPDSLLYAAQQQQQQQQHSRAGSVDASGHSRGRLSVLRSEHHDDPCRLPPGVGEGAKEVAICFTDIQSSTELWETHPQGMYEGLDMHNRVMREAYARHHGYEVKTIGDSFMVAFDEALDALHFGLDAQQALLRQHWPEDLLRHPLCERRTGPGGEPLWGGLRVRIGVQHGPARVENNPVTQRCDYFGPTVNVAARLEAVLRNGGLVATSSTVAKSLDANKLKQLGSPVLHDVGIRELKGVKDHMRVWVLTPQVLELRLGILTGRAISVRAFDPLEASAASSRRMSTATDGSSRMSVASFGPDDSSGSVFSQRLQLGSVTCCVARISLHEVDKVRPSYSSFATAAALAADMTGGVVDSLLSTSVVVTWNASRPCVHHTAAGRQFLGAQFRARCHLGAASGKVLSGSVSAGRRSFAIVVGGCIELAVALAEEAERCGDPALAAGTVAHDTAALGAAFCAQLWTPPSGPNLIVWEVDVAWKVGKWDFEDSDHEPWSQRSALHDATITELFQSACAEDPGSPGQHAIRVKLEGLASPPAAARLAARIARGAVRRRPMPKLWDPGESVARDVSGPLQVPGQVPRDSVLVLPA